MWLLSKLCEIIFRRKVELAKEICKFHKYRNYSDGIDLFDIHLRFNFYVQDHKPSLEFNMVLFNYIFEFNLYNVLHVDKQQIVDKTEFGNYLRSFAESLDLDIEE